MSYTTISLCVTDAEFVARINSCAAQEQLSRGEEPNPGAVAAALTWAVAAAGDVEAAYASALANHDPHPGANPAVITDGMILSHVQGNWPTPPA